MVAISTRPIDSHSASMLVLVFQLITNERLSCLKSAVTNTRKRIFILVKRRETGLGETKNLETAFDHYLKAAEDGVDIAKAAIGGAFFLGEGVAESDSDAVKWFSLVADDEDLAKYYLGQCYYDGVGVPEDEALGVNLLRRAARRRYGRSKRSVVQAWA